MRGTLRLRSGTQRLRTRIVLTTAIVSAVAMTAMIATVVLALNALTRNSVESALNDRFSVISDDIQSDSDGPTQALETTDDAIDDTTWLYGGDGDEIDGPKASHRVQSVADRLGSVDKRTTLNRFERVYLAGPVKIRGPQAGKGVLVVSKSLEPYQDTRTEIIIGLALLGLVVTAGATAISAWTVGRTLEPVEAMAALADEWSERALDARFDDPGTADEIAHLGRTLNILLDRVAGALRSEQLLTSELAHELRTPLTGIRGEAELALMRSPGGAGAPHLQRVIELTDRMSGTISTLVALARGDEHHGTRTTVGQVVLAATDGHLDATRPIELDVEQRDLSVSLAATTDLAVRALAPLVDNARQYAASRVAVTADIAPRSVDIHVSDDGPGLAEDPETLFEAGTRGSQSDGAGLGLSLARRVARTLGGRVDVTSREGPTTFTLTLPRS